MSFFFEKEANLSEEFECAPRELVDLEARLLKDDFELSEEMRRWPRLCFFSLVFCADWLFFKPIGSSDEFRFGSLL